VLGRYLGTGTLLFAAAMVLAPQTHAQTHDASANLLASATVMKSGAAAANPGAQSGTAAATSPAADAASPVVDPDDQTTKERVAHLTAALKKKWNQAVAALPSFCGEWQRMLHDREVNNLAHLQWQQKQGYATATYVGYGKILGCKAKESEEGVPLGKVVYEERDYYLAGKTPADAEAHPQLMRTTNTLEIFSWEKDRWFY